MIEGQQSDGDPRIGPAGGFLMETDPGCGAPGMAVHGQFNRAEGPCAGRHIHVRIGRMPS